MTARKVLVCGSRSYSDTHAIESRLEALRAECEAAGDTLTIVEGGARGADQIAGSWARRAGVGHVTVHARWSDPCRPECEPGHRRTSGTRTGDFCPAAGVYRNQAMLDEHGPIDLVLAWVDRPLAKSRGTADMVRRAIDAGIPYELVEPEPAVPMARLWEGT